MKDLALFYTLNIMQLVSLFGLTGLLISIFFFPGILYGLPQIPMSDDFNKQKAGITTEPCEVQVKNNQTFQTDYLDFIEQKN